MLLMPKEEFLCLMYFFTRTDAFGKKHPKVMTTTQWPVFSAYVKSDILYGQFQVMKEKWKKEVFGVVEAGPGNERRTCPRCGRPEKFTTGPDYCPCEDDPGED
jgi:hypothetical protein